MTRTAKYLNEVILENQQKRIGPPVQSDTDIREESLRPEDDDIKLDFCALRSWRRVFK
jgi:hypothetical protein